MIWQQQQKKLKISTWNKSNHQNFVSVSQGHNSSVSHYQSVKKQRSITWLNMWWYRKVQKNTRGIVVKQEESGSWVNEESKRKFCLKMCFARAMKKSQKALKAAFIQILMSEIQGKTKVSQLSKLPPSHLYCYKSNSKKKAIHKNFDCMCWSWLLNAR